MEHFQQMIFISLLKIQGTIMTLLAGTVTLFLAVLVTNAELIFMCYAMIFMHVGSGWCLAWKSKHPWSDDKWFRTGMKFLWFPLVIIANGIVERKFDLPVPLSSLVAAYLITHDLKGFVTNVGKLTGTDIWSEIADRLKKK